MSVESPEGIGVGGRGQCFQTGIAEGKFVSTIVSSGSKGSYSCQVARRLKRICMCYSIKKDLL